MQTSNRLFDDLAKMANGALSVAAGARQEIEQLFQQRLERFLNDRGWVTREEFEAVRDMTQKAREEQESLLTRLAMLEAVGPWTGTAPDAPRALRTAERLRARIADLAAVR